MSFTQTKVKRPGNNNKKDELEEMQKLANVNSKAVDKNIDEALNKAEALTAKPVKRGCGCGF